MPTGFGKNMGKRANTRAVLPAMVGKSDQAVALRVAAGEQRAARGRAQRRRGVGAGEDDAFGGQPVQSGALDVGVAVGAEVAAEVVPVDQQDVVPSHSHSVGPPSAVGPPNTACWNSATLWLTDEVIPRSEFIHRLGLMTRFSRVCVLRSG